MPTVYFDGVIESVGGSGGTSMYDEYLPLYQQRKEILSDFTIDVQGSNSQLTDYAVQVTVENVAANSSSNLRLMVALTETDIPCVWMGQPYVNFCERFILPDGNGTTLDFSGGDILDFSYTFSLDPEWVQEHCELVVWIQNFSNKEVQQTAKRSLVEFGGFPTEDVMVNAIYSPVTMCNNSFEPGVEIVNIGTADLTSLDFVYQIDNQPEQTYSWNGNIAFSESNVISLPEVNLSVMNSSMFTVHVENPNGQTDEFPYNDTMATEIFLAEDVNSPVTVVIKLDSYPEQTSWEVTNSAGTVLYSGGNYTSPNVFITESLDLTDIDCYSFKIYDSNGDGLAGTGIYKLMYGTTIFQTGKEFGYQDEVQFGIGLVGTEPVMKESVISIFPNPASGKISINSYSKIEQVVIYDFSGRNVYETNEEYYSGNLNISEFEPGLYIIKIETEKGTKIEQVVFY